MQDYHFQSLNKICVIGHKMDSFSFVDSRHILKKITDCVKNDEDIYLPTQSS